MSSDIEHNIATRLKKARETLGYTHEKMAELLGVSKRSYTYYEAGRHIPVSKIVPLAIEKGINLNWLLTGQGEIFDIQRSSIMSRRLRELERENAELNATIMRIEGDLAESRSRLASLKGGDKAD